MKLLSVDYSLHVKNKAKYTYHFDNGTSVVRNYVSPFTRLNAEVFAIKIPFFRQYIFANELLVILVSLVVVIKSTALLSELKSDFELEDIYFPVIFILLFPLFSWTYFTIGFSQLFTYLKGNNVDGIVTGSEEYKDSENRPMNSYALKLPNGAVVVMNDFVKREHSISDTVKLKIHPDNIPYTARASKAYIYGLTCFCTLTYVAFFCMHMFRVWA